MTPPLTVAQNIVGTDYLKARHQFVPYCEVLYIISFTVAALKDFLIFLDGNSDLVERKKAAGR